MALLGVVVNVILSVIKVISGVVGNSYALIADGVESLLDVFGSLIVWFGLRVASAPPDDEHPYGHGKAEVLTVFVVALVMLGAAVFLAIESIDQIVTPHKLPAPFTLIVLLGVVVVKHLLFRRVLRLGGELDSTVVKADAWHHYSDAITSAAAFIGITIALIGGPGWESADDWAALLACGIIAWNGISLFRPALLEVMDTAPSGEIEKEIRAIAMGVEGVQVLEQCRIRKMGLDYYVDLHVGVDGKLSVRKGHDIAHAVRNAIRAAKPAVADVLIHIEPEDDMDDDGR